MGPNMSVQPIELTVAHVAVGVSALVGLVLHVDLGVAPQVGLAHESLLAVGTFEGLVISLY